MATVLAFLGTGWRCPRLFRVTRTPDRLKSRLDHYARWYAFSAFWQAVAFLTAVLALAVHSQRGTIVRQPKAALTSVGFFVVAREQWSA